ncbi:Bromodomain protein [Oesophagostomum dentatum]|uniref:Bromodomain protein n=1 Tax=Oesophagostomum dentatum TaxID=61180 RepID=A0A0B1SVR0_OESDE|nr:Bromodomain protein [Oesophagostomum dentatum]
MDATRKDRIEGRPKGFFTPAKCKAEFDRVMSEPCPTDVATGAEYSRAAVVDAWLAHFWEEDKKDAEQYEELQHVKIRLWMERIAFLQENRDKITDEQFMKMYDDVVREDEAVEYDDEEKEFRDAYAAVCIDYLKKADQEKKDGATTRLAGRLPPTRPPDQSPLGPKTAFRSPSPGSSPLKSPSRSTADSEEPHVVSKGEDDHGEPMEVDEQKPLDHDGSDTPSRSSKELDLHGRRPRGRPPKKTPGTPQFVKDSSTPIRDASPAQTPTVEEHKSPTRETRRSSARNEAAATPSTAEKEPVHVVDSPAGRVRGARRPAAVDSPLVHRTPHHGRSSAGSDVKKEDAKEELKRSRSRESSVVLPSTEVVVDEFGGTGVQTALSIRMPLWNSDNDLSTIVVGYPLSDMLYGPSSSQLLQKPIKEEREAHCSNDQTSRIVSWDDVLDGSFRKKEVKKVESTTSLEEQTHVWNVVACGFSDPQAVRDFVLNHTVGELGNLSLIASPPKRLRKEEKATSGSAPTPKMNLVGDHPSHFQGRMLSMWNTLHEHRHSAIFLHPVTDRDAPGYSRAVFCPVDLTTLRRETDSGAISSVDAFTLRMFLMFANAAMFNSTGHDVNLYAKEMAFATIDECMYIVSSP